MKFAMIGVGGYIASRHLRAIKDTGNELVAALDKNDSVGIIDSFFPDANFFTEFERFDRYIDKLRRLKDASAVDFVSICSPNYLHDAHIRFALRSGANAICEKPLVLNPWNLDGLIEMEKDTGKKLYNILQLRVHENIVKLKEEVAKELVKNPNKVFDIDLTYITSRGHWYFASWKGDLSKSGGVATNIGVHFYDMLTWIFGAPVEQEVHYSEPVMKMSGYIKLKNANVRWFLSVDREDLPEEVKKSGKTTFRSITYDGKEIEFSEGFTDLHTAVYRDILAGKGYGLNDVRPSIELVHDIRESAVVGRNSRTHPLAEKFFK